MNKLSSIEPKPGVATILAEAVEIDSETERRSFVERACAGDEALCQEIQSLIDNHVRAGSFLESPAVDLAVTIASSHVCEAVGNQIGPYKLRELLGEGGMGSVFVAEQEKPVRRKVALKIIKPGMGSREVISRFETERQAIALMDHPNIARVLDAGTTDNGLPYFVMELVKGLPITDHCNAQKLGTRDRLELFLQVCHAVQHAHQKAIIHRDLKPSNVIVAIHDVMPVVKVIDFGVAKAIGQHLTDNTLYTAFSQMLGTPLYMSPEQAGQSSIDIDTRSDVYSLGVLLYELLTGNTPFDEDILKQAGIDEMRRIIREVDPPKPSTRVSTLSAEAQSTVAGHRQIEPRTLSQQFRGELDWIVMKAIEKDRNRRYDSAISFAADVQRFLDDLPVEASPPSTFYRLRKLAKRHRIGLITSAALLFMMIAATALSTRYAFIADRALTDSERDRKAADAQRTIAETQRTIAEMRQKESDRLQQQAVAQRDATQQALYKADIRMAGIDYRDVNPFRLHNTLKTHIPAENTSDMRAWEWHYLLGASHQEASAILGHRSNVEDVAWSPDGRRIASTGYDGVRICDASSGVLIYNNEDGHTLKIGGAWSPDSRRYAWGNLGKDLNNVNTIRIWDSSTNEITFLRGHTFSLRQVCWSPDGRRLLSVSLDRTCRIWDVDTQKCLFVVQVVESVRDACWNPMRDCAAIARGGNGVLIINPTTGEVVTKTSEGDSVISVAFSADGTKLLVGDSLGRCIIHDVDNWKVLLDFQAHENVILGIAANPKYPLFATCGADGVAHIWRLADGRKHWTLFGHDGAVNDVDWDPTGLRLVTGSSDQRVLTWNVLESPTFHRISLGNAKASAITWDADSSNLSCTTEDGSIASIDIATRKVVKSPVLPGQDKSENQPKSAAMEEYLESWARDPTTGNKQVNVWKNEWIILPLWSGDKSKFALITRIGIPEYKGSAYRCGIAILDAHDKAIVFREQVYGVQDSQWAPDHRRLAVAGNGQDSDGGVLVLAGWVYIFDYQAGEKHRKMRLGTAREPASAIGWNPSGTRIVAGNVTGLACIWDAADGKLLKSLAIHQARIQSFAWSPDAKRIASADSRGQVKILDAETLEELLTLSEGAGGVKQLAWSPDGRQLAGIHSSGNVIIWNASRGLAYGNSETFKKRINSEKSDALIVEAEFHLKKNDLDSETFTRRINSHHSEALIAEAEVHLKKNDLDAALRVLDQLLQADTDHVNALTLRGKIFYDLSRFTLATADFKRVTELAAQHQVAWYKLGESQMRLGQFDEAIVSLTAAYDASPDTGDDPRATRAVAYIQRGDVEKGQSELQLLSDKHPISFASCQLAVLFISRGEFESYRELCKRITHSRMLWTSASGPYAATMIWTCVLGPNAVSDYAPFIQTASKIRSERPADLNNAENYGAILFRAGHFEDAMKQLVESSVKVVRPLTINLSWYLRAMTHKQLKQESEAIAWLEKADAAAEAVLAEGNQVEWQHRLGIQFFQKEARELIRVTTP